MGRMDRAGSTAASSPSCTHLVAPFVVRCELNFAFYSIGKVRNSGLAHKRTLRTEAARRYSGVPVAFLRPRRDIHRLDEAGLETSGTVKEAEMTRAVAQVVQEAEAVFEIDAKTGLCGV